MTDDPRPDEVIDLRVQVDQGDTTVPRPAPDPTTDEEDR